MEFPTRPWFNLVSHDFMPEKKLCRLVLFTKNIIVCPAVYQTLGKKKKTLNRGINTSGTSTLHLGKVILFCRQYLGAAHKPYNGRIN